MKRWTVGFMACAALAAFAGCPSGGGGEPDAGNEPPDAATGTGDAGVDAGAPDAGMDAGEVDAGCDVEAQSCGEDAGSCLYFSADGGIPTQTACFVGACDLVARDCAPGQRCTFVTDDAGVSERACTLDGTIEEGQPCGISAGVCKSGLECASRQSADGGVAAVCSRFCNRTADCVAGDLCYVVLTPPGTIERPLLCGPPPPSCDILAQDCENLAEACYPEPGGGGICLEPGASTDGGTCMFLNDCVKGLVCVGLTPNQCRPLCRPGTMCADSTACQAFNNLPDAGFCQP